MSTESAKCATSAAIYEAVVYLTKDISPKHLWAGKV